MLISHLSKKKTSTPSIKICMMGGKGAGKSSVLASLYANASETLADTNLYLTPAENTISLLGDKLEDLKTMFRFANQQDEVPAGISGDYEVNVYNFNFGLTDSKTKMILEFKDFPGETIINSPDMVSGFIGESNVVLIAIDTPHMMEENGLYCETRNRCDAITNFIIEKLDDENKAHKLFLLVPLKCEKYYYEQRMNEVCDKVNEVYSVLISRLKGEYKTEIACAITPIMTLGDVVFNEFEKNFEGEVITNEFGQSDVLPASVKYKYRCSEAQYSPRYCEQPLYYLLSYISKEYQLSLNSEPTSLFGKLFNKFRGLFKLMSDDPSFLLEVAKLKRKQVKNNKTEGYVTVSGNNLL